MEVDTKTVVIIVLGLVLMFMLFSDGGIGSSIGSGSSSTNYQAGYGIQQGGAAPSGVQTLDNLPSMVGGC